MRKTPKKKIEPKFLEILDNVTKSVEQLRAWGLKHGYVLPVFLSAGTPNATLTIPLVQRVVAPLKYEEGHFLEVDELVIGGSKQTAALDDVSKRHGFNREGFEKQYRTRHLKKKVCPSRNK